jgi:hypothetical protein
MPRENCGHSVFDNSPFRQTWSRKPVEGQSSWGSSAQASFNGRLHMVHPGESSTNVWHSVFDGDHWSPNDKVPDQTSKTPRALAVFNGTLHMVHTGGEGEIDATYLALEMQCSKPTAAYCIEAPQWSLPGAAVAVCATLAWSSTIAVALCSQPCRGFCSLDIGFLRRNPA